MITMKILLLFLVCFASTSIADRVPGRCPIGWLEYSDVCFFFENEAVGTRSEMEKVCGQKGAYLFSIPTKGFNDFLNDYLIKFKDSQKWWTSGVRRVIEVNKRLWTWYGIDGLSGFHYKQFDSREEEEQFDTDRNNIQKCLKYQLRSKDGKHRLLESYIWVPSSCTDKAGAICVKAACPKDWFSISSRKCIKLEEGEQTYTEQWSACKADYKGGLLSLNSTFEFRELEKILKVHSKDDESKWRIVGGDYLGFDAHKFKKHHNYYNRYGNQNTLQPCRSQTTCSDMTNTFAAWLPGEPKFFKIIGRGGWTPSFDVTKPKNSSWTTETGYAFGIEDGSRSTRMKSICQILPEQ